MKQLLCISCGQPFREDEGELHTTVRRTGPDATLISYANQPYNWSAANGYCLTCWLVYPAPPGVRDRAESAGFEQN